MAREKEAYQTIDDMTCVRIVTFIRPLSADVVHNLVLTLTRDAGVRDDYLELSIGEPSRSGKNKCDSLASNRGRCSTFGQPNIAMTWLKTP